MKRLVITSALATVTGVALVAPAAAAPPSTVSSVTDMTADVSSKSLDMTKASLKSTGGGAYKGAVKYRDLKVSKATRRVFSIQTVTFELPPFPKAGKKLGATTTWALELRTTPDGKVVSKYWKNGAVTSCAGAKAVPNYAEDKVAFSFPASCVGPFGFLTIVGAQSWKQPAGVPWSPTDLTPPVGAALDGLDTPLTLPTGS